MTRSIALSLFVLASSAYAGDHVAHLSKYDPGLKLVSFNQATSKAIFRGNLQVRGTIYFEFDRDQAGRNVGVTFAKFVPARSSSGLLPAVISGYYAGPVRYVSLEPAENILVSTLGKREAYRLSHGTKSSVSTPVELVFLHYTAEIECDSREYWSDLVAINPAPHTRSVAANVRPPAGC